MIEVQIAFDLARNDRFAWFLFWCSPKNGVICLFYILCIILQEKNKQNKEKQLFLSLLMSLAQTITSDRPSDGKRNPANERLITPRPTLKL